MPNLVRFFTTAALCLAMVGCVAIATNRLAGNLSQAIQDQDDPETVRAGAPAYLLLMDGLIEDSPNNPHLLLAGAQLYGAYTAVFVKDKARAQRLMDKARTYSQRALCIQAPAVCAKLNASYPEFAAALAAAGRRELPALYGAAVAWAGWIQSRTSNWAALADLPKVEAMLRRVLELDPDYEKGQPQLYLAVMGAQLPPALGGRPEQARAHFEKAVELSHGRNLIAKVEYAKNYARLVYDKALFKRLLKEVVAANPYASGLTLSNVLAQREARELLQNVDEYFPE